MCNVSQIMDQWAPHFPSPSIYPSPNTARPPFVPAPPSTGPTVVEPADLRELIAAFYKALDAARSFDRLTGQPDCEDPEKAKLLERVAELERRLNALETA